MAGLRALLLILTLVTPAFAVQPDEVLSNPELEARARALSQELRCMVCQNQSIDDSDAPLARDLRLLVRERLAGGDTDQQVLDFLVARYGDFVLLKPRFSARTALLWLLPPAAVVFGLAGLLYGAYRRRKGLGSAPGRPEDLTPEEQARLTQLVEPKSIAD
jgi:cytochrome c-type biogenesis protein CcmH